MPPTMTSAPTTTPATITGTGTPSAGSGSSVGSPSSVAPAASSAGSSVPASAPDPASVSVEPPSSSGVSVASPGGSSAPVSGARLVANTSMTSLCASSERSGPTGSWVPGAAPSTATNPTDSAVAPSPHDTVNVGTHVGSATQWLTSRRWESSGDTVVR